MELSPQQLVADPGSEATAAATAAYAFSATLAIQDITGLATSGVTASHIAKRLEPSAESEALLFALTELQAPRPATELGYRELYPADTEFAHAWVFISLPLLEDLQVIEANIVFDSEVAPLPGDKWPKAPWESALQLIDELSATLSRPIRHIWVTHAPGAFEPPAVAGSGYSLAFREEQATCAADAIISLPTGNTAEFDVVEGPGFAGSRTAEPGEVEQFSALLTSASKNYPRGQLALETIEWDLKRIVDAGARLSDRGGLQLTGLARVGGKIVGLCEAVRYVHDDPKVCELGLFYLLPEHRGRGIGAGLLRATITRARETWESLETVYCSYPADSPAASALAAQLGAEVVSSTSAWQKA